MSSILWRPLLWGTLSPYLNQCPWKSILRIISEVVKLDVYKRTHLNHQRQHEQDTRELDFVQLCETQGLNKLSNTQIFQLQISSFLAVKRPNRTLWCYPTHVQVFSWWRGGRQQSIPVTVDSKPPSDHLRTHLKHTVGKSQTNATNVTLHLLKQAIWGHIWKPSEDTFENQTVQIEENDVVRFTS